MAHVIGLHDRINGRPPVMPRRAIDSPWGVCVQPADSNHPVSFRNSSPIKDRCAQFEGVCAACPENPARKASSSKKRNAASNLPPMADRAIQRLTQCRNLTHREREVLTLCCSGQKNTLIAATLGISASAVRRHLRNLHQKTNTSDKAELILNLWHSCRGCQEDASPKKSISLAQSKPRRGPAKAR